MNMKTNTHIVARKTVNSQRKSAYAETLRKREASVKSGKSEFISLDEALALLRS
jgi:hypothetical protein